MSGAKIPIWGLTAESYRFVLAHPRDLARIAWAPLIVLLAANLLLGAFTPSGDLANMTGELSRIAANFAIQTVVAAAVLVGWHRFVLLGEPARPAGAGTLRAVGRRELRYLISWVLLSLVFLALLAACWALVLAVMFLAMSAFKLVLLLAGSGNAVSLGASGQFFIVQIAAIPPAMLLASYVAIRLSLVLPAMAVDRDRAMGRAWSMSKGNGWRLVLASFLTLAPAEGFSIGVSLSARSAHDGALFYLLALVASAGLVFLIVVTGTVLSLFSRDLDAPNAYPDAAVASETTASPA